MDEIMDAVAILQSGDKARARELMHILWERLETGGTPIERATLAHFLADTEEDVAEELHWDLAALKAATGADAGENEHPVSAELATFLPSLHLNVGDAFRRSGDPHQALLHAELGLKRSHVLADDGYGTTIRQALLRLRERALAGKR
ncbi:hypothetical protein [Sphingosinicella rhizophila]|uniref:Tetratricopeptide repeat protein n=1 Tax=Sphingosinicella rhizophila TaxID=3050082 RepID=A0ABU3Q9P1_9SPHN|nr:hypothetical protein [Sphingosinicella sp. GR2756]MDT9600125.1 hypothetical protein [Sphingosinicella sp. GR2756]